VCIPKRRPIRLCCKSRIPELAARGRPLALPQQDGSGALSSLGVRHHSRRWVRLREPSRAVTLAAAWLLFAGLSGCAAIEHPGAVAGETPPTGDVTRVEALWQESGLQGGNVLARGFAGRIYLFGQDETPIIAPGELSVYTFDDNDMTGKPKYVWRFKGDDLKKVTDKTVLGWSYALWIPWERGDEAKNCTIIVRYRSPEGRVVASTPGRIRLPPLPVAGAREKHAAQATANAPTSVTS
jgi:hypothetical protein